MRPVCTREGETGASGLYEIGGGGGHQLHIFLIHLRGGGERRAQARQRGVGVRGALRERRAHLRENETFDRTGQT